MSEIVAADQLRSFVERIERVDEEVTKLKTDRREILAEAKGNGFDTKVLKKIIRDRKRDREELQEERAIMEIYEHALEGSDAVEDDA